MLVNQKSAKSYYLCIVFKKFYACYLQKNEVLLTTGFFFHIQESHYQIFSILILSLLQLSFVRLPGLNPYCLLSNHHLFLLTVLYNNLCLIVHPPPIGPLFFSVHFSAHFFFSSVTVLFVFHCLLHSNSLSTMMCSFTPLPTTGFTTYCFYCCDHSVPKSVLLLLS